MNQTEKLHINILLVFSVAVAVKIRDYVYVAAYVQATQHTHDCKYGAYIAFIERHHTAHNVTHINMNSKHSGLPETTFREEEQVECKKKKNPMLSRISNQMEREREMNKFRSSAFCKRAKAA